MAYQRKTIDTYEVQGFYSSAWETLTVEDNRKDARTQLKIYNENDPYPHRIKKARVKK